MRGDADETIESQQEATAVGDISERPRPSGGKALLRLLQLLVTAGYADAANATIEATVPEEDRQQFVDRAEAFRVAPPARKGTAKSKASTAKTRGTAAKSAAVMSAEDELARMYMDVGEQLRPPTATGRSGVRSVRRPSRTDRPTARVG